MASRLTGISSMATRHILAELAARYQETTWQAVAFTSTGGVDAARRVRAGEPIDIVILASDAMAQLEAEGHVTVGSRADFARSGMAVAVRSRAQAPAIDKAEAVKQAILGARKIGYSTGPSGDHLMRLCEQWGIREVVAANLVKAPPGVPVGALLAQGEVDLGFQQLSELRDLPGIDIVGSLPPEIQATTVFTAGLCRACAQADAARALLAYLTSPQANEAKLRGGMDPPEPQTPA